MNNKAFIITISIVLVVIMGVAFCVIMNAISTRDYVLIQKDGIYFDMTKSSLLRIKGTPIEVKNNVGDTGKVEYVFNEQLGDYKICCSYYVLAGRLIEIDCTIKDIDYYAALEIINEILDAQGQHYSQYDGYYCGDMESSEGKSFSLSHGVNTGFNGIAFDVQYVAGVLTISGVKQ